MNLNDLANQVKEGTKNKDISGNFLLNQKPHIS